MGEIWPQVENNHSPHQQWKTHTKPDTTDEAQSKKIHGVFMFGCAAREITKNRSSLPALQELQSPQDVNKIKQNQEGDQYHSPELENSK